MNATQYDAWCQYYDPDNIEKITIDKKLSELFGCSSDEVWSNKRVLEIGCGTGRFSFKVISDTSYFYAIDPDSERIEIFKKKVEANPTLKLRLNSTIVTKTKSINELTYDDLVELYAGEKFDIVLFSWSWTFIDEEDKYSGKAKALNLAMSLLKKTGYVVVTMVIGGEFETLCENCRDVIGSSTKELDKNKLAINKLLNLAGENDTYSKSCVVDNEEIKTYFSYPDCKTAAELIRNEVGLNVAIDLIYDKLNGRKQLSDILDLIILSKKDSKKITFNYKLCDNRGDCSARQACEKYSVGAIVRQYSNITKCEQLRVLDHLCVQCNRCLSICELFQIHNTWAEYYEKCRQITSLELKPQYMDEFRFGSGSGDDTRRINSIEELQKKIMSGGLVVLEILDNSNHSSSYDCPKIEDLIGRNAFDRYYYKFDIPAEIFEEARKWLDINLGINKFPALVIVENKVVLFKYTAYLSLTRDQRTIDEITQKINSVLTQKN